MPKSAGLSAAAFWKKFLRVLLIETSGEEPDQIRFGLLQKDAVECGRAAMQRFYESVGARGRKRESDAKDGQVFEKE